MTSMPVQYYCKQCKQVYSLEEYNDDKFCKDCNKFLSPQLIKKTPKEKGKPREPKEIRKNDINLETMWHEYTNDRVQPYSTVPGMSVHKWIAQRKDAYRNYQEIFHPSNLHDHEWVKNQFKEWLQFKNNRSWTQLHRTGYAALTESGKLVNLLFMLQDETLSLSERFDRGLKPPEKVSGVAEAILTGLLHTFNPEKNGVVNSRTRETLETLRRKPINIYQSESLGAKYVKINKELHQLAEELQTDLVYIDGFMWYVSQNYSFI